MTQFSLTLYICFYYQSFRLSDTTPDTTAKIRIFLKSLIKNVRTRERGAPVDSFVKLFFSSARLSDRPKVCTLQPIYCSKFRKKTTTHIDLVIVTAKYE